MKMALMVMVTGTLMLALGVIALTIVNRAASVATSAPMAVAAASGSGGADGDSQVNSRSCPGERPSRKCRMHE